MRRVVMMSSPAGPDDARCAHRMDLLAGADRPGYNQKSMISSTSTKEIAVSKSDHMGCDRKQKRVHTRF